ncbi:MAG: type II secretion system F family protein [Victivallales bacterium]|nr:type II secretion system F family protein [Victivallales bacterium]
MSEILNLGMIACFCAFLCVTLATLVFIDFISYVSARYKEKYLQEATAELDDVLLQVPAGRILDVSMAGSAFVGFMAITIIGAGTKWTWGQGIMVGIILATLAFPVPRMILKMLKKQRMKKFNNQLEDAMASISSSLKAGFSINQALETIVEENIYPISVEFRLLVQEMRLGVSLEDALEKMLARLESPDFELVATAIITARQTGGELTVVLDRLAGVIRERLRISNKLSAMTAQGKMQAGVIGAMPIALMFAMTWITPRVMDEFFGSMAGILLTVFAFVMVFFGFIVIKKILTIDI